MTRNKRHNLKNIGEITKNIQQNPFAVEKNKKVLQYIWCGV